MNRKKAKSEGYKVVIIGLILPQKEYLLYRAK